MNLFDLRYALRRLARSPTFSTTSILLLGLAFGTFACVFSVVYGLLYKPLPYPQSERLVSIESRIRDIPSDLGLSVPLRDEIARNARTLDGVAAFRTSELTQRDETGKRIASMQIASVEPALFGLLGARAARGRLFADEDVAQGAARNAIISWDEWQQRYAGADDAIGQGLRLEGDDYRIIGVLPKGFVFPSNQTRIWLPLGFSADERARSNVTSFDGMLVLARLRPDTEPNAAQGELRGIAKAIPELDGAFGGTFRLLVEPLRSRWIGDRRESLLLMLLAASMVWLVSAANVANLFLAQALGQRHEIAVNAALGAAPWRHARNALIEVAMLCSAGVLLGCALLPAGLAMLRHFDLLPQGSPQAIGIDAPTIVLVAALAALLCAALTMTRLSVQRGNLHDMIRCGSSRQTPGTGAQAVRKTLVVAQVALTVALLFGIGVLLRSSQNLLAEDIGFHRDHLLYAMLDDFVAADATPELRAARLGELAERARLLPGAVAAGLGSMVPFGGSYNTTHFTPPGQQGGRTSPIGWTNKVNADYFTALGMPLLRGRDFNADEVRAHAPVAIVDELFVKRHFGDTDPLGQHFGIGTGPDTPDYEVTVVGVVSTLKQKRLDEAPDRVAFYQPDPTPPHAVLVLRTTVDPNALIAPLKVLGEGIAPKDSIGPIVPLSARIADTLRDRTRLNALLGLLGATALLLAAVGLYAVLAYAVRVRVTEFGVRMALGASAARVQRTVLGQGLRLICAGLLLGAPLAWLLAHALGSRLYHVGAFDPPTLIAVVLLLAAIGVAACWRPARRAAKTDPIVALRNE
ncbi:MAG TPA: ADOP family duplicated permease [Dokdonella sp.]|nr:ADOP family duplicated permease [Dokdonella sp.]